VRQLTTHDRDWRLCAADWLETMNGVADAEGMTDWDILEDRRLLVNLWRRQAHEGRE